jgi:hypothetical protein
MSKFIGSIVNDMTGHRVPDTWAEDRIAAHITKIGPIEGTLLEERELSVCWRQRYSYQTPARPGVLETLTKNVIEQLKRDIYGDLRDLVLELERAIYSREGREAERIIGLIRKEIA